MTALQRAYEQLVSVLELLELPYAVGGSFASSAFGIPRSTLDVDLVVKLDPDEAAELVVRLAHDFLADADYAREAIRRKQSFNAIHIESGFKFDIFPTTSFAHGENEVTRRKMVAGSGLTADGLVPMVSPEDIVLAKLAWFRLSGDSSERQWRDVETVWSVSGSDMDRLYLEDWAAKMGTADLLLRLMGQERGL